MKSFGPYARNLLKELQEELRRLTQIAPSERAAIESGFLTCTSFIQRLWTHVETEGFATEQAEIIFFKNLLPLFNAELEFYKKRYHLLLFQPTNDTSLVLFYESELAKVDQFYLNNLEFLKYHESGASDRDQFYFLDHEPGEKVNDFSNLIASKIASARYRAVVSAALDKMRGKG